MEDYYLKSVKGKIFVQGDEDGFMDDGTGNQVPFISTYNGLKKVSGKFNEMQLYINLDGEKDLMNKEIWDRLYYKN